MNKAHHRSWYQTFNFPCALPLWTRRHSTNVGKRKGLRPIPPTYSNDWLGVEHHSWRSLDKKSPIQESLMIHSGERDERACQEHERYGRRAQCNMTSHQQQHIPKKALSIAPSAYGRLGVSLASQAADIAWLDPGFTTLRRVADVPWVAWKALFFWCSANFGVGYWLEWRLDLESYRSKA